MSFPVMEYEKTVLFNRVTVNYIISVKMPLLWTVINTAEWFEIN